MGCLRDRRLEVCRADEQHDILHLVKVRVRVRVGVGVRVRLG